MSEQIKETEMMIGNWFIGYDGKPFRWSIKYFALLALEKNAPTIDELIKSPIPLTEEILLKCGFRKGVNGIVWISISPDRHIDLTPSDGYYYPQLIQEPELSCESVNTFPLERISSVHELQNLFRILTQTDLKVEV